jgi:hypothetical protein
MPGLQWAPFWEGNRAELFATYVLSSVAAVVGVPRQVDFGLDLLCTLTRQDGNALYAGRAFGVQVKSAGSPEARYGGLKDGAWKKYEIDWLYGQDLPMLLCTVDLQQWRVSLYSVTRMWWVRWKMGIPGEIILVPSMELGADASRTESSRYPRQELPLASDGTRPGDGYSYRVPLGQPVVSVSLDQEDTRERRDNVRECLDRWVHLESRNVRHYQMKVPYTEEWMEWTPNTAPTFPGKLWHYYNPTRDQNVPEILSSIGPAVASLYHQLRIQRQDAKVEQVVPLCRLLEEYGNLDVTVARQLNPATDAPGYP